MGDSCRSVVENHISVIMSRARRGPGSNCHYRPSIVQNRGAEDRGGGQKEKGKERGQEQKEREGRRVKGVA